jgi:hypothetical protein
LNAPDLALLELIDVPSLGGDGQAAGAPVNGYTHESKDSFAAPGLQTFEVKPEVGTRVLDVGEEPPDAIRSSYTPATGDTGVCNWMSSVQQAR